MAMAAASSAYAMSGVLARDSWQRSQVSFSGVCMKPIRSTCSLYKSQQRAFPVFCVSASSKVDEEPVAEEATCKPSPLIPNTAEIETLLKQVCDETKVAELDLKVGSDFKLHMRRSIQPKPAPPATLRPSEGEKKVLAKPQPKPVTRPTEAKVSPLMSKAVEYDELQRAAAESGVVFINSPKVGLFRPGRLVKGKFGPPLCKEGQTVNEGQIVCYLEQLGTHTPIKAEISGDVIKVLWEDGVPVGYGDPLIAVKPKKA